jgi:hypothetical protein
VIEQLFVDLFLEAQATPPRQIILDLGATDVPLHTSITSPQEADDPRRIGFVEHGPNYLVGHRKGEA